MAVTFEKDLLGQIVCSDSGIFNFSADLLIGNVQQSAVRILCDTSFPDIVIQLPAISDFQGAYADLLIIIADIKGNAGLNNITILTNGDSFQFQSGTGFIDKNGGSVELRVTTEGLWNVGGGGLTYGG